MHFKHSEDSSQVVRDVQTEARFSLYGREIWSVGLDYVSLLGRLEHDKHF